ncbi:PepSY-associated TM helix domain-containing protein [Algoriphagus sp.]|uniref:PepSY-associated TM helix domain-containing protein n=1 Tax=Algoriphagus sp. TaxID=1872435 RepID=UPI00261A2BE2|nr:PepSY-associated TM helix domain-containing protein [Algoriphagus sp.]
MKLNKRVLFQVHSWIGIKLSILFFIVCFSGTLATLSNEMDWLYYPGLRATSGEGKRAPYNDLVHAVQQAFPHGDLTYWIMPEEPYLNDIAYVQVGEQRHYVFVDPVQAKVTGSTTVTFQRFFRDFHYYLFMPFYQFGYFIVLVFAFFLLIALLTALVFYKKWWKKFSDLKTGKGPLVFFRSLHRVVGLWSIPFAILFSVTGIWYFTERTNLAEVSSRSNPPSPKLSEKDHPFSDTISLTYQYDYDAAVALAKQEIPTLKIGGIVPGNSTSSPIYLRGKSHVPLVRKRSNRVWIDPVTQNVAGVQKAEEIPTVMYLNDIADPLHFGNWGGLTTKLIWFLAGLSISGLIVTGIWIALKRQLKKVIQDGQPVVGYWKYLNWAISLLILGFMYYFMLWRYSLSWSSLSLVSLTLGLFAGLIWYVFEYRLKKSARKG